MATESRKNRKDVQVHLSDPTKRAAIEAKRGIVRDEEGRIVRSKEWRKERRKHLKEKIEDFQRRIRNAQEELKSLGKDK